MTKLNLALTVATKPGSASALVAGARSLADNVAVVFTGSDDQAGGADQAYRVPVDESVPFIAGLPSIIQVVLSKRPDVVLVEASPDGRLVAAALAAELRTGVMADVTDIGLSGGHVVVRRMVYGGAAVQELTTTGTAIVTASAGLFESPESAPSAEITDLAVEMPKGVEFLGKQTKAASSADLSNEKVIVGVGRGVGSADGVEKVRRFASAIGAGVGATRPVAEEVEWFDGTSYIGISGETFKPDVYIACGVSGQVQHMVGVSQAGLVFAINNDERATIFGDCDYGIVGDVNRVVPELTARFEQT